MSYVKKSVATLFTGVVLMAGTMAAPAEAANNSTQDGLVNVSTGDIAIPVVISDIDIGVAAAANLCGFKVGPVAVLGAAVDRSGATRTVCTTDQGPVNLTQN